jgi:ketopantoate reductase
MFLFSLIPLFMVLLQTASVLVQNRIQPKMKMDQIANGVIVGGGRIGNLLYELNGKKDVLLTDRDSAIPDIEGPIYVATRNNDLDSIIEKTPLSRRENLVFMQNGMLAPYLLKKGLVDNTQCLIYFAVSKKGENPIDGKTELNPEGLTAVTGKWADDFANRLKMGNLACHVLDKNTWYIKMLEKHIWICAFMAVGAMHNGCTVGEVESKHNAEVRALIEELASSAAKVPLIH